MSAMNGFHLIKRKDDDPAIVFVFNNDNITAEVIKAAISRKPGSLDFVLGALEEAGYSFELLDYDVYELEKQPIDRWDNSKGNIRAIFDTHGGDSKLNHRTGQTVEVLRELTEAEADIADVGRMFHVRFLDGFESDAFEEELTPCFVVGDEVKIEYISDGNPNNGKVGVIMELENFMDFPITRPDGIPVPRTKGTIVYKDGSAEIVDDMYRAASPVKFAD